MWKRILTLVTALMAIILSVSVLVHIVIEAKAVSTVQTAEEKPEVMEIETHETEPAMVETEPVMEKIEVSETEPITPETEVLETEPEVTEFTYVEKFTEVPHYFQTDYPDTPYGRFGDTVATDGCGITSLAMVLSYLLDEEIMPDELAEQYGRYCTGKGSSWKLFPKSAEDYGVTIEKQAFAWSYVVEALKNGRVVIANVRGGSIFTTGGHFIVLDGITEDGRILVKDPYRGNYAENKCDALKDGFANGFEQKYIAYDTACWWIYAPKDVDALAAKAEELNTAADIN